MNNLRVAAVVMQCGFAQIDANLAKMKQFVRQAALSGAEIVCFPEMNITGYALKKEIEKYAEPVPGPSTMKVQRMAKEHKVTILAGLAEKTPRGTTMITQLVVSPSGDVRTYCKLHLSQGEREIFEAGEQTPVFKAGETTFGVQLCYDAHFPELSTLLALRGAEVIFMPHASPPPQSPDEKRDRWLRYLAARAYDNSTYVVACNQTGDGGAGINFSGVALVLDPRGEILTETSGQEERMLIADLNAAALDKTRKARVGFFLAHRRPELYGALSAPITKDITKWQE
jgi:N-carbamoylputrescine amidase